MVVIDKDLVRRLRYVIFERNGTELPRVFKKKYKGKNIDHKTIEYRNVYGRTTYFSVPVSAIRFALNRGAIERFDGTEVTEPITYWGRKFKKILYSGDYTTQEIRDFAQEKSNDLARQGKQGKFSVAVKNWGVKRGVWRSGELRDIGDTVRLFLSADSDGAPIPDRHDGFALIWVETN